MNSNNSLIIFGNMAFERLKEDTVRTELATQQGERSHQNAMWRSWS